VFAVAATLLDMSGCYAEPGIALTKGKNQRYRKIWWARQAIEVVGPAWANKLPPVPKPVELLWRILYRRFDSAVCDDSTSARVWKLAALRLLAIADESRAGVGWLPDGSSKAATFFLSQLAIFNKFYPSYTTVLNFPTSICLLVPPEMACVQPKANTPTVGCTIRSLSHHLALLPGKGAVGTEWRMGAVPIGRSVQKSRAVSNCSFNVLLIPFPYILNGESFIESRKSVQGTEGYFSIRQNWLACEGREVTGTDILDFVLELIAVARRDVGSVNCIVFPEASLTPDLIYDFANKLAIADTDVEFVIGGVIRSADGVTTNEAHVLALSGGSVLDTYIQRKHHRWRLDPTQITTYNLGHALHPGRNYWEDIDLGTRQLHFGLTKDDAVITALVCEDLARADPVMPALLSIGPNLVFALLMDGPQLIGRWSSRYATVLADDPGAAILTLTCLGMVRRARTPKQPLPGPEPRWCIGLWRQPGGDTHELDLPKGYHGLVLSLSSHATTQVTLDLRDDQNSSFRFTLSSVRPVKAQKIPDWLALP
jgi:hypothetical protein